MATKKVPMRMCTGCKEMKPKKELIRVVKTADGEIFIDNKGKANGRGAYICNDKACLEKAIKIGALSRAFATKIPQEIYDRLKEEIENVEG